MKLLTIRPGSTCSLSNVRTFANFINHFCVIRAYPEIATAHTYAVKVVLLTAFKKEPVLADRKVEVNPLCKLSVLLYCAVIAPPELPLVCVVSSIWLGLLGLHSKVYLCVILRLSGVGEHKCVHLLALSGNVLLVFFAIWALSQVLRCGVDPNEQFDELFFDFVFCDVYFTLQRQFIANDD